MHYIDCVKEAKTKISDNSNKNQRRTIPIMKVLKIIKYLGIN